MTALCTSILMLLSIIHINVDGYINIFPSGLSNGITSEQGRSKFEHLDVRIGWLHHLWRNSILSKKGIAEKSAHLPHLPPSPQDLAATARYIVHAVSWASMATISTLQELQGAPFSNVVSINDGFPALSTGVPYMYVMRSSASVRDLTADRRVSLSMTMAETEYCHQQHEDPQLPLCARVILNGNFQFVDPTTAEYRKAQEALFSRHPSMKQWPLQHNFQVARVDITDVHVLDYFGGMKRVNLKEYFNVTLDQ